MSAEALEARVISAAEAALEAQGYVGPLDVLCGIGWLPGARLDAWRQGRLPTLSDGIQVNPDKVIDALDVLMRWATANGLTPSAADYVARTRDRRRLVFVSSDRPAIEDIFRTHWVSPDLSDAKKRQLAERQSRPPDLVVIQAIRDWKCEECGMTGDLMIMEGEGPLCLQCADMDHLVLLGAGDAALTR